jgi:hypothetical protein
MAREHNKPEDLGKAAVKFDGDKPRLALLPPGALAEVAKVMGYGAAKYTTHNWRRGFDWTRLLDASLRHVNAWNDGEDKDPETGLSHVAHAACCLLFLLEHELKGMGTDDRFKGFQPAAQVDPGINLVSQWTYEAPMRQGWTVEEIAEALNSASGAAANSRCP